MIAQGFGGVVAGFTAKPRRKPKRDANKNLLYRLWIMIRGRRINIIRLGYRESEKSCQFN